MKLNKFAINKFRGHIFTLIIEKSEERKEINNLTYEIINMY
jgi:hypothetical protein